MRASLAFLALCLTAVTAVPTNPQRIVGGSQATINQYPYAASLLFSWDLYYYFQVCGGTIINNRSILTAAHCFVAGDTANSWRIRVGSSWANNGGVVHNTAQVIIHGSYDSYTYDHDIAILRSATDLLLPSSDLVRMATIAGSNYNLADNQAVWAIGWGLICSGCFASEPLRHVQIWVVNQNICRDRYQEVGATVTDNMLCSGWLDVGGLGQCTGDDGSPLIHNNVVVGIRSWGQGCAQARYPGVNVRVSRYISWIQSNA